jgi:hypothetical protein
MRTVKFHDVHNFDALVDLAQTCNTALAIPGAGKVTFDLSDVKFAEPHFATIVAGLTYRLQQQGKDIACLPPDNSGCNQYLTDIGLLNGVLPGTRGRAKRPDTEAVDLSRFSEASPDIIWEVTDKFMRHLTGVPDVIGRLEQTFAELMDNVFAHSQSPVGGILCGQFYPTSRKLRFAVCDFGMSIPGHLGLLDAYRHLPDEKLIQMAFQDSVTGSTTGRRGSGLPFVKELTQTLSGWVKVYSRQGSYTLSETFESSDQVSVAFPGTLLYIDWSTSQ